MILDPVDQPRKVEEPQSIASPSETDHLLLDIPAITGPPPEFALYEAEHFEVGYDDVVSHDPHLNTDGEALYRFLLSQAEICPFHRLHCRGTHSETRQRWITERDSQGRTRSRQESYSENVVDFDFCIDISPQSSPDNRASVPVHWSVADDEPAYRGKMVREYEASQSSDGWTQTRRKTPRNQVEQYKNWVKRRTELGYPPWVREEGVDNELVDPSLLPHFNGLRSSKTIREWADDYCASPKYMKEFVYEKVLYGWNMQQIESAVRSTIEAAPYNGCLTVEFTPHRSKVYIRPDNKVSRMLSNKWLRFISIILFIFPFIWLFKRFHSRGGGRWEVCGGAYALKQWVPLELGDEDEKAQKLPAYVVTAPTTSSALTTSAGMSRISQRSNNVMQTSTGLRELIGLKEGEWFRGWEGAITRAVIGRYQSRIPLPNSTRSNLVVQTLDGYHDFPTSIY